MGNEYNIKLSRAKINKLFYNMRKLDGGKNLLAKKLRITTATLDTYLRDGQNLIDREEYGILEEVLDIDTDFIDEEFNDDREDLEFEFKEKEKISSLGDKYRNAFEVCFYGKREVAKEEYIYKAQKEVIENATWSDNESENERFKLLVMFKLTYDRADMSIDEEKLYLKSRYTKTSSKHVNSIIKDLERRNSDDFGEPERQKEISGPTTNNINNNFIQVCLEQEKMLKALEQKDDNIIDV